MALQDSSFFFFILVHDIGNLLSNFDKNPSTLTPKIVLFLSNK